MQCDLEHIQENFARALIDPTKIDLALDSFSGNVELNRERFGFYRGNIIAIWQQTCASAFPVLKQLTGADFFDELARAYGQNYPSRSGNLNEFGANMVEFIQSLESCRPYPYLGDVAGLEWTVHRCYYMGRREPAPLSNLAAIPVDQLSEVRFRMQPGCALFESPWAVADIWQAHQIDEIVLPQKLDQQNWCLIWQSGWKVEVASISAGSYTALNALLQGFNLGLALDQAMTVDPQFSVQSELADWFQKQLITTIISPNEIP